MADQGAWGAMADQGARGATAEHTVREATANQGARGYAPPPKFSWGKLGFYRPGRVQEEQALEGALEVGGRQEAQALEGALEALDLKDALEALPLEGALEGTRKEWAQEALALEGAQEERALDGAQEDWTGPAETQEKERGWGIKPHEERQVHKVLNMNVACHTRGRPQTPKRFLSCHFD
ncbi:hypothetical protein M9458_052911, partial [Cirrhinus mrigala]